MNAIPRLNQKLRLEDFKIAKILRKIITPEATMKYLSFISKILCTYPVQNRKFKMHNYCNAKFVSFEVEIDVL